MPVPDISLSALPGLRKNSNRTIFPMISTESSLRSGILPSPHGVIPDLFYDTFSSASLEASILTTPEINNSGFSWSGTNRTSIVTMNPGPVRVWANNGVTYDEGTNEDWTAKLGHYSLRFLYPAGGNLSEQRFDIGQGVSDLWFRFWFRIPTNFNLPGGQTKFFAIWHDGYEGSGDGSTVFMDYNKDGVMRITHSSGRFSGANAYILPAPMFDPIEDRGRWMQMCVRITNETSEDADDGTMTVWRRWDGIVNDWEQTHYVDNWRLRKPISGPQGFAAGYLMGYVNTPYSEVTEWLWDGISFSTTDLR